MTAEDFPDWPYGDAYAYLTDRVPRGSGWTGITVGPHWAQIIIDTDAALARLDPDYEIFQVKEKHGGLRYYCSIDHLDEAEAIIREAEARAERTCDACGSEGDDVTNGKVGPTTFWRTLCGPCRERAAKRFTDPPGTT